ncbi:hypothetical protein HCH52_01685 [Oscillospiraceae bacterium HV4-5-C5C]|nr:hypothetical protein [Oscillospiraceae bacterium HV4-5-C5C]
MAFCWSQASLEWYRRASQQTGFHVSLARLISPLIKAGEQVLDLGCGLALLELELLRQWPDLHPGSSPPQIIAVDRDQAALAGLQALAEEYGVARQISVHCQEAETWSQAADTVILSFFGGGRDGQADKLPYIESARRLYLRLYNLSQGSHFSPRPTQTRHQHRQADRCRDDLARQGLHGRLQYLELEFGQPLADLPEACRFIAWQQPGLSRQDCESFARQNLRPNPFDRQHDPLYLPHLKQVAILEVQL